MALGSARRVKGLASVALCPAMKRSMAAWRLTTERKAARLRRRLVSLAKKPSTAFSHDAEVGVKGEVRRG